uniref:Uncharacterized protein n=1 Tax=Steinernema glaseri TaxID=37863 RepID=A0A1I7YQ40_9BILA
MSLPKTHLLVNSDCLISWRTCLTSVTSAVRTSIDPTACHCQPVLQCTLSEGGRLEVGASVRIVESLEDHLAIGERL